MLTARYKAQKGTYISVVPTRDAYLNIAQMFEGVPDIGRRSTPADIHCTVMYAPDSVLNADQQLMILLAAKEFEATAERITSWVGGDGDSYVVLELSSPGLSAFNTWLRTQFGMRSPFPKYKPHITLVSSLPAMPERSHPIRPFRIKFNGLRIEDAK